MLALFVPLIISSGGNSGRRRRRWSSARWRSARSALRDWWRVMRREILRRAGARRASSARIGFLRITRLVGVLDIYGEHWLLVGVTVALALVGVVLWGTLIGSLLPFLLRRLGFDPATSSAPFVATLVDVTGLVIYFSRRAGRPARHAALVDEQWHSFGARLRDQERSARHIDRGLQKIERTSERRHDTPASARNRRAVA